MAVAARWQLTAAAPAVLKGLQPIERQLHFERHGGSGVVAAAFSTTTAAAKPRHLVSYRILACKMKDLGGRV